MRDLTFVPEGGARCISSARRDLYGRCWVTSISTVTIRVFTLTTFYNEKNPADVFGNHENDFIQSFVEVHFGIKKFVAAKPNSKKNRNITGSTK